MAKATLGRLQREASEQEEQKKKAETEFQFVDESGKVLFSVPERTVLSGKAYNQLEALLEQWDIEKRKVAPETIRFAEDGDIMMALSDDNEKRKAWLLEYQEAQKTIKHEKKPLREVNRLKEYQVFLLSLDLSNLTTAQRTKVETLTTEDGAITDFWLCQDIEKMKDCAARFRKRVGL